MDIYAVLRFLAKNYFGQETRKAVHMHLSMVPEFKENFPNISVKDNMYCPRNKIFIIEKSKLKFNPIVPVKRPPFGMDWWN